MQIFQSGHNQAWPGGYFLRKVLSNMHESCNDIGIIKCKMAHLKWVLSLEVLSNMHDIIHRVATVIAQQPTMMDGTGVGKVSSMFYELDEEG